MESRGFLIVVLDNKSPGALPHLQALDPGGRSLPACGPTFAIWRLAVKPSLVAHDHSPCGEYTRRRADRGSSPQCRRQRPGTFNIVVAARDAGEACRHLLGGDAILSHAALPVHEAMKAPADHSLRASKLAAEAYGPRLRRGIPHESDLATLLQHPRVAFPPEEKPRARRRPLRDVAVVPDPCAAVRSRRCGQPHCSRRRGAR